MPLFDISFLRVDRDESPTVMEALFLSVDGPLPHREGEGVEPPVVDNVGYGMDGSPLVPSARRARRPAGEAAADGRLEGEGVAGAPAHWPACGCYAVACR